MKRNMSSNSHRDESTRSRRSEDSRSEEERLRRRREWMIQQEREQEHERLKKKMILEYEIRRAREKGLQVSKGRLSRRSRSSSSERRHTSSRAKSPKTIVLSERLQSEDDTIPLFKGPEQTQISVSELRRIKVNIHRKIVGTPASGELQRDILNPEDVVLKRREGEGSKPIFEREEIKSAVREAEEIEEHRTVTVVSSESLDIKPKASSRHREPISPVRTRTRSPRRISPSYYRNEELKHDRGSSHKTDRRQSRSVHKSRECKDGDRRRSESYLDEDHLSDKKYHRDSSRSGDRQMRKRDKDSPSRSLSRQEYRGRSRDRSRERSRDRRDRDTSREYRAPTPHYIEQIPVPIYYGNFPPRPIMVGPLVPVRGPVPLPGNRHFPMMAPIRPFLPRYCPPDIYRMRSPSNCRYGPRF